MSISIASIEVTADGDKIIYRWRISAEAHAVGLHPAHDGNALWLGDDLGSPEGAGVIDSAIDHARDSTRNRVLQQWDGTGPLF